MERAYDYLRGYYLFRNYFSNKLFDYEEGHDIDSSLATGMPDHDAATHSVV